VPVSFAVWGLVKALSVISRVALRAPVALGVKVTVIVHFAPAASVLPQVVPVSVKLLASAPLMVILLMSSATL
jgi:hypothetical protein